MSVKFENFSFSYLNDHGKRVFVPNEKGYTIGYHVKSLVERATAIEPFYFHLLDGGHVAALHVHRKNQYFARADLKNFFYSISRNRVARALHEIGVPKAGYYAKCSCVKNPYNVPSYSLPYGFVQSPILATLVLSQSVLGAFLQKIHDEITVSVYMDDIAISSPTLEPMKEAFNQLKIKIEEANFQINLEKTKNPLDFMQIFNCNLEINHVSVTQIRKKLFDEKIRSAESRASFDIYCKSVERGNNLS